MTRIKQPINSHALQVFYYRDIIAIDDNPILKEWLDPCTIATIKNNPDTTPDTPCLFLLQDIYSKKFVSGISAFADTLHTNLRHDHKQLKWLWTGSLKTPTEHMGRGYATELLKQLAQFCKTHHFMRGSVFSTEVTLHIYKKIGAKIAPYIPRYLAVRSIQPIAKAHIANKLVQSICTKILNPILSGIHYFVKQWHHKQLAQYIIQEVKIDALSNEQWLLDACSGDTPLIFNNSTNKLIWKINTVNSHKDTQCQFYKIIDDSGKACGYFIARTRTETTPLAGKYKDFSSFSVVEYGLTQRDDRSYKMLLALIHQTFLASRADILQLIAPASGIKTIAKYYGLISIGKGMSFSFNPHDTIKLPKQITSWQLNHFSGDAMNQ